MSGRPDVRSLRLVVGLVLALAVAACSTTPAPTPARTDPAPAIGDFVLGCVAIEAAECRFVAQRIVGALPQDRRAPFNVLIHLSPCRDDVPCPLSLGARQGRALIEYGNGLEPLRLRLAGPPADPQVEPMDAQVWTEPIQPTSQRVAGPGPFEFEVGHCGLQHIVDFDGSFWVIAGQVREEVQAMANSERGIITRNGPNAATYLGTGPQVGLARFPGAKRFFLCD